MQAYRDDEMNKLDFFNKVVIVSVFTFFFAMFIQFIINWIVEIDSQNDNIIRLPFFKFVFLAPLLESLISFFVILVLVCIFGEKLTSIILGFLWGGVHSTMLHGLYGVGFFIITFVAFYLYARLYFYYKRDSIFIAVFAMVVPHSLHNFYVFLLSVKYI